MSPKSNFWYLATEYTKYPGGIEKAYQLACKQAYEVYAYCGLNIFSPIAHTHGMAVYGGADPLDAGKWLECDAPFMEHACGLIVITSPTWKTSKGIQHEISFFELAKKPIWYKMPESKTKLSAKPER